MEFGSLLFSTASAKKKFSRPDEVMIDTYRRAFGMFGKIGGVPISYDLQLPHRLARALEVEVDVLDPFSPKPVPRVSEAVKLQVDFDEFQKRIVGGAVIAREPGSQ